MTPPARTSTARPAGGPASLFAPPVRVTSLGLLLIITLIAFEATAVAAALPTAARDLHGLAAYGWAFTGLFVASVIGMVLSGRLSDSAGPRRPLVVGLTLFLAGLLLAGTATTMAQLVAGRVVQGLATGLIITAAYVVIGQAYPESLRPKVFAAISSAWVLPSLFGPVLSGTVTQQLSWRWVFLGLAPLVVVAAVLLVPVLRGLSAAARADGLPVRATRAREAGVATRAGEAGSPTRAREAGSATRARPTGRLRDSHLLRAAAAAAGVVVLEQAAQHPSWTLLAASAAGLLLLGWGLARLLPPGAAHVRPGVAAAVVFRGMLAGCFTGVESIVPLAMGLQHGYGATAAALPLTAGGLSWAFGSWWQGRVSPGDEDPAARGRRSVRLVRAGFAFMTAGLGVSILAVQPALPGALMFLAWALVGIGAGLGISTASVLLLRHTTEADRGTDAAALQLSDALSAAISTGLAGGLVAAAARGTIGHTAAFTLIGAAMVVLAACGMLLAGRARDPGARGQAGS